MTPDHLRPAQPSAFLEWLLVVGIAVMILCSVWVLGDRSESRTVAPQPTTTPVVVEVDR